MKTKLLASAPDLEELKKLINRFYGNNPNNPGISFLLHDGFWSVTNGSRLCEGVRVVIKKGRYRFEMEQL